MKFTQFVEIFGSFNYEVPQDKEQQLYDFYMLSLLHGRSSYEQKGIKSSDAPKPTKVGEFNNEDKIDYLLEEVAERLLPVLKNNLLSAVFFSVCAEVRHIYDNLDKESFNKLLDYLSGQERDAFKKYTKQYLLLKNDTYRAMNTERLPRVDKAFKGDYGPYVASYEAFLKSGAERSVFASMAKKLFEKAEWSYSYGGPAWAQIAEGWASLNNAKTQAQLFVQIDHVYDLQHNTDTVFNKISSYTKNSNHSWIKKALDHKAKINNPYEIMDQVSPTMKSLAQRAIWTKMGISEEEFNKRKIKYQKEEEEKQKEKEKTFSAGNGWNTFDDDPEYPGKIDFDHVPEPKFTMLSDVTRQNDETKEVEYKWLDGWINAESFQKYQYEAVLEIQKKLASATQNFSIRNNAINIYRAAARMRLFLINGNDPKQIQNFLPYNLASGFSVYGDEILIDLLMSGLGEEPSSSYQASWSDLVDTAILKPLLNKAPRQEDLGKMENELEKEVSLRKYFDTTWDYTAALPVLNGQSSSETTAAANKLISKTSNAIAPFGFLGLKDSSLKAATNEFLQNPNNKINLIKFIREQTGWGLKVSKGIAEFIMAYEALTNPNWRKYSKEIKATQQVQYPTSTPKPKPNIPSFPKGGKYGV